MTIFGRIIGKFSGIVDIVRATLRGREVVDGIEIYGRQEFRRTVKAALLLLRDNRVPAWDSLTRYVKSILEGTQAYVMVTPHPAFMFIDEPHWRCDRKFLAGTIAYMACSCQLHRSYEAEFPGRPVPRDVYFGSAALERCEQVLQECLLALGKQPGKTERPKDSETN